MDRIHPMIIYTDIGEQTGNSTFDASVRRQREDRYEDMTLMIMINDYMMQNRLVVLHKKWPTYLVIMLASKSPTESKYPPSGSEDVNGASDESPRGSEDDNRRQMN